MVDANIFVRALSKPTGSVGPVLRRLREGSYTLVYTDALVTELEDVLRRPRFRTKYGLTNAEIEVILDLVATLGERVVPAERVAGCRDPDDDALLEAALAGRADVIVSGDDDPRVLSPFRGIDVVSPWTFLAMLTPVTEETGSTPEP